MNDPHPEPLVVQRLSLTLEGRQILHEVSFSLKAGELLAIVGPSGSGKSSLLGLVAGFLRPGSGQIWLNGSLASDARRMWPPEERRIGMVFQSHALWPQMPAIDNVAFPLRRQGRSKHAARAMAESLLEQVGMEKLAHRYPEQLSGGQQQRVGLARALAAQPVLYLFDEPTANLDPLNRQAFAVEIKTRLESTGAASLYVTHQIQEAFEIADRVLVLMDGSIRQLDAPTAIYERPVTAEVAALSGKFSGFGATVVAAREGEADLLVAGHPFTVRLFGELGGHAGESVRCMSRPEWCVAKDGIPTRVSAVRYQGGMTEYELHAVGLGALYLREMGAPRFRRGDALGWRPSAASLLLPSGS